MSARERLLAALRAQNLERAPLPALELDRTRYADLEAQFRAAVADAKGRALSLSDASALPEAVTSLDVVRAARRVASLVAGVPSTFTPASAAEAERLEVLVAPGELGVAESGAVWVTEPARCPRAALFASEHVVLVVSRDTLVHTLHDAYERLGQRLGRYGCFMAGPSKTADIEQALVVGAHGARSLTVFVV